MLVMLVLMMWICFLKMMSSMVMVIRVSLVSICRVVLMVEGCCWVWGVGGVLNLCCERVNVGISCF